MRKYILITLILTSATISAQTPIDTGSKLPDLPCAYNDAIQRISDRNSIYRNTVDITFQVALRLAEMISTR